MKKKVFKSRFKNKQRVADQKWKANPSYSQRFKEPDSVDTVSSTELNATWTSGRVDVSITSNLICLLSK